MERVRDVSELPKAHLHLHFTGSMRPTTLLELADKHGVRLPETLTEALGRGESPKLRATDERGWFRFQRLYDAARSCLQTPEDIQRLVREAAEEDLRDGSGWLEIQVDPTSYAPRLGGLIPALEIILDAVETTVRDTGIGMRVLVAANRMKHPLDARTLARLAVRYAERGVVGFGLSNDERRGMARDFDRAFAIARDGGLLSAPHGGELTGPASVRDCLDDLEADRIGHGVRAAEDPRLLKRLADRQVTCEVCPASNVALGVYEKPEDVPLRRLFEAGVPMALGADDPLLFGARLAAQYEIAREHHGFTDAELAELARQSVRGSAAPEDVKGRLLAGVDDWLTGLEGPEGPEGLEGPRAA
ncbi:adenosine deaminase [Streptomyces tendae]|uniref:adenosine deaminase n=1 Tax=Streptomyces tendae TaxID=1932 RepID=UPI0036D1C472